MNKLFEQYTLGSLELKNKFLMAPMTRSRSTQPGNVPNALMAEYYGQRASAGIIITEATQVSLQGQGYAKTPGIYSDEQVAGWKLVTDEVHKKGGKIFVQLWHVGRVGSAQVNGLQPLAPSAIAAAETSVYVFDPEDTSIPEGDAKFVPVDTPREMTEEDIRNTIQDFKHAAANAMKAGFDGVEIHGANGYLIDEFLRSNSNKRSDKYGGSKENRITFPLEVVSAVAQEIGKDKVGVRVSPFITFKDMQCPEIIDTTLLFAQKLNDLGIAYIHLSEADWDDAPDVPQEFRKNMRDTFTNTIIATGKKTPEIGEQLLTQGYANLIGFGRSFLTNPDFPKRVKQGAALNEVSDTHTLFGGGTAKGYTDYPFLN